MSYSLFGYGQKYDNCFSFDSYLSGLMLSLRFNKLLYPSWHNILQLDKVTHEAYEYLFSSLEKIEALKIEINEEAPLCKAMLWRLKPIFWGKADESEFTHVICRDLDSLSTYREVQAVKTWIDNDKAAHAIADSVSHTIPMLGGMIGFRPSEFTARTGIKSFENLIALNKFDMSVKGADQKFLNQIVYPHFSEMGNDSITQHYFKGHANTWLSDFHTCNCWLYNATVGHKPFFLVFLVGFRL